MSRPSSLRSLSLLLFTATLGVAPVMALEASVLQYGEIPDGAYSVVAEVHAKPGKDKELRAATLGLVAQVRAEPGNLLYFLHEDREAPGHFVFYEIFTSRAHFDAHNATPHVQAWFARLPELATGGVKVLRMEILGNRTTLGGAMKNVTNSTAALALGTAPGAVVPENAPEPGDGRPTIVLVHGAFVDGSGWAGVYGILRDQGYPVVVVQNPTTSLADDVAATRRAIAACKGDVVLVGHSYGGVVITEAGTDPKVSALVYVAAFAPDRGESVSSLNAAAPPDAPKPPILAPTDGFLLLDKAQFPAAFAADVPPDVARFMADSQLPWGVQALSGTISSPAWKVKPSWYLVPEDDRMIPADAQRGMAARAGATVRTVPGSHAVYVANPRAVAVLIGEAATAAMAKRGMK